MELRIEKLKLRGVLGVYEEERGYEREIEVSVRVRVKDMGGMRSDRIEDVLDYDGLVGCIRGVVEGRSYYLIEKLAGEILEELCGDERVEGVELEVGKPGAVEGVGGVYVVVRGGIWE